MSDFKPYVPEKKVSVPITTKEAHLIKCLRSFPFGKVIVYKMGGKLVRIETVESILLDDKKGEKALEKLSST